MGEPNDTFIEETAQGVDGSVIGKGATPFSDLTVVDRTPLIGISSDTPLSEQQDNWTAGVTHIKAESEYRVRANASTEFLETERYVPYQPGYTAEAGISIRVPEPPTGNQEVRWGYWNGSHGTYWGFDSDGVYTEQIRGDTRQGKTYEAEWNGVHVDPDVEPDEEGGRDAADILAEGAVTRKVLSLYNNGEIGDELYPRNENNRQTKRRVHTEGPRGQTTLSRQNLPLRVEVDNPDSTDFDVFVADRQAALRGAFTPDSRGKGDFRTSVTLDGTTWVPVISFRRKPDFRGVGVEVLSMSIQSADDLILQVRSGADLTGANFETPAITDSSESATEWDTSATSGNGTSGQLRWGPVGSPGGQGNQQGFSALNDIDVRLKGSRPMTLFARLVSGSGGSISLATMQAQEGW